jgi:peptide-methionine (S)-S-oxide reductase
MQPIPGVDGDWMKFMLMQTAATMIVGFSLLASCQAGPDAAGPPNTSLDSKADKMNLKQATFAAGCFWGVEVAFRKVDGVVSTEVGYSGGHTENPTYRQVCTDRTGHAESVLVNYDPAKVSYAELLDAFWTCHDPTTLDRQGPDVGSQYRSVIFFHDADQEATARASLKEVEASHIFKRPVVTEIVPASTFYPAEDYHQQYFEKQGVAESCHVGIAKVHTDLAAKAAADRKSAAASRAATQPAASASSK